MSCDSDILSVLPSSVKDRIINSRVDWDNICEIRIRSGKPVMFCENERDYLLSNYSGISVTNENSYIAENSDIKECLEYVSNYSLYAYEDEIRQGFITIKGGHRIGICGKTVLNLEGIKTIRNISSINIRIAHEIIGAAQNIADSLYENDHFMNTLIISPPGYGKTTILRDLIRIVSNGTSVRRGINVSVIDERCEISASYRGVTSMQLGDRTDVLDACPKRYGMLMALRSMSPKIICVDELGQKEEFDDIKYVSSCGVNVIATIHGKSIEDVFERFKIDNIKVFKRFVVIKMCGGRRILEMYNEKGEML